MVSVIAMSFHFLEVVIPPIKQYITHMHTHSQLSTNYLRVSFYLLCMNAGNNIKLFARSYF